jgi:hypothetical protein
MVVNYKTPSKTHFVSKRCYGDGPSIGIFQQKNIRGFQKVVSSKEFCNIKINIKKPIGKLSTSVIDMINKLRYVSNSRI